MSLSKSVLPAGETFPSTTGIMLVLVLPISIITQSLTNWETIQPVAAQFADATSRGAERASAIDFRSEFTFKMKTCVAGKAFVTCVRMLLTPSRLVRYASDNSAVIVIPTQLSFTEPLTALAILERIVQSFSGYFQTGKYSIAVLILPKNPLSVLMYAALVLAPPMSKPSTFTTLVTF